MRWEPGRRGSAPMAVRVADLVHADPAAVAAAVRRLEPTPDTAYVTATPAGTLLTLERRVPSRKPWGRWRTIRDLQAALSVIAGELESPSMPTTSDRPE